MGKRFGREYEDVPSKGYRYHCKDPSEGFALLRRQLWVANVYRNILVKIEQERRKAREAKLAELDTLLGDYVRRIDELLQQIQTLDESVKRQRAAARKRIKVPEAVELAAKRKELKALRADYKAYRATVWGDVRITEELEKIKKASFAKRREARAQITRLMGLYWGTYLAVETDISPSNKINYQFRRFRGTGRLAIQLNAKGIPVADLFNGRSNMAQIDPVPEGAWAIKARRQRIKQCRTTLRFRVGSRGKRKEPVWAVLPITIDRELPPHAKVKWIYLTRRYRGAKHPNEFVWSCSIVIASKQGFAPKDLAPDGVVGIDIGYRARPHGLRVAYWAGSDGRHHELVLPQRLLDGVDKVDDIRSIRQLQCNTAKLQLGSWLKEHPEAPKWLHVATETLAHWRGIHRLSRLFLTWRGDKYRPGNRFPGDEEIFAKMSKWYSGGKRKDGTWDGGEKHLRPYEINMGLQIRGQRLDIYRKFAVELRKHYRKFAIEQFDLRVFSRRANSDDAEAMPTSLLRQKNIAALSELTGVLKVCGAEVQEYDAENTTRDCHLCSYTNQWDQMELFHTCDLCGERWDQDYNAAMNLLRMGMGLPAPVATEALVS